MDQKDDSIFPDNGHLNGTSEGGTTGSTGVSEAPAAGRATEGVATGLRPGFLAELAVAMRATAQKERERIAARVADDAAAHVDKVRARAAIETDELKRLAEEDVQHIQDWSTSEMERIRGEADKKIEDRRSSLEEYLQQHDSIIDTEIEGVNEAVSGYSATLDRYFEELAQSEDPSTIVARAEALPAPPDLDQVRAQARSRAVAAFAAADEPQVAEAAAPSRPPWLTPGRGGHDRHAGHGRGAAGRDGRIRDVRGSDVTRGHGRRDRRRARRRWPTRRPSRRRRSMRTLRSHPRWPQRPPRPTRRAPSLLSPKPRRPNPQPIPVMDPTATAESTWPASEPTASEPEPVAATVDHTSAAVRLLRSVAPWTAPTHAGTGANDRSESE